MGKLAWDDSHKYDVRLSVREMRIIACALFAPDIELYASGMNKVNAKTFKKLRSEFIKYNQDYFRLGFYPTILGDDRAILVEPIDKP